MKRSIRRRSSRKTVSKKDTRSVIRSSREAKDIGLHSLHKMVPSKTTFYFPEYQLPSEIAGPWEINKPSLFHTISYLMEKLHHNCYILSIVNKKPTLYKLQNSTTSPTLKPYLLSKIDKHLNKTQQENIRSKIKEQKEWRVLQCILKKYSTGEGDGLYKRPYVTFFEEFTLPLPDGLFVLNLTDAVLLRKDHTEPWPMVTGSKPLGKYDFPTYLPILGGSGHEGYWDIPIPNYDDIQFVMDTNIDDCCTNYELDWNEKQTKAIFRGGVTGCGRTSTTNMRIRLAKMKSYLLDL